MMGSCRTFLLVNELWMDCVGWESFCYHGSTVSVGNGDFSASGSAYALGVFVFGFDAWDEEVKEQSKQQEARVFMRLDTT
jgi:membrane-bound inhibitor of C-type lysozyme